MRGILYRIISFVSRLLGPWFFTCAARIIAFGYYCFSPKTRTSDHFYGVLFPEKSSFYHRWCTFQQYQNFTTLHIDRLRLNNDNEGITFTSSGLEHLESIQPHTGGIILQSHLGNWDIAAHLLRKTSPHLELLLYMGIKDKEAVERLQKNELSSSGITIIGVGQDGGSPFEAVEGIAHLRNGGIVAMTGDMLWQDDQRHVTVDFLEHKTILPAAPYIFALLTGAPLLLFFTFQNGGNSYHFSLSEPLYLHVQSRQDREQAIAQAAGQYATRLEHALRKHPFEWYHFEKFIQ